MNRNLRAILGAGIVASTLVFGACSSATTEDDDTGTETETETDGETEGDGGTDTTESE